MAIGGGSGVTLGFLKYVLGFDSLAFQEGIGDAQKRLKKAQRDIGKHAQKISSIGQTLSLGLTAPAVAFAGASLKAASDAEELQSAFNQTFGAMAKDMNKWAVATGDAMGRSTQEIQRGAQQFGLYFNQAAKTRQEAAKMARTFTVLGQDLASFHNTSVPDALDALRSGLSGESEPLRRYGVFLNDAAVSAKAAAMGLEGVNGKLTDQQKIMARAALIMDATKNAQGDVARTSESTANRVRAAKAAWEELSVTVGTKLLPAITPLIGKLTDFLNLFTKLSPGMQSFAVGAVAVGAALGPIMMAVGPLVGLFGKLLPLLVPAGAAATTGAVGFRALGAALVPIAALSLAAFVVWEKWDTVSGMIERINARLQETKKGASDLTTEVKRNEAAWADFSSQKAFEASFGQALENFFVDTARLLREADADLNRWQQAINRADAAIASFARNAWNNWEQLAIRAGNAMRNLVSGIANAFGAGFDAILNAVKQKIQAVGDKFKWLWDVVVGHSYIPDMVDAIGQHMARLDVLLVQKAQSTADKAAQAFQDMAAKTRALLSDLFPEVEANLRFTEKIVAINEAQRAGEAGGGLSPEMARAARHAAVWQENARNPGTITPIGDGLPEEAEDLTANIGELGDNVKLRGDELAMNLAQAAESIVGAIQGMVAAFKNGGFWDKVLGVLGVVQAGVQAYAGFGGFRASGGPTVPGKSYIVGENGPEWFTPGRSGYVTPSNDNSGGGIAEIRPSPLFDIYIDGKIVRRAAPMAGQAAVEGSSLAQRTISKRNARRIP